ncbi:GreA/GreB family elongation factor [Daejeonella lutea]|uniref:Regulator of nucleoside diphosphate kinase n=1 Tax=Daejeonella lutea TaxID=572036 RepID=A0A1T5EHK7_9SPHI|nr:GreA/GreB family elongation factor [Daejeonella lutea]SKB83381.1 regulator of nucleoside diphosphate kinase [Daejeonella lutea]
MKNAQLILSKSDHELLNNHLKLSTNLSEFNKKKLGLELKTARVISPDDMPGDVVSANSYVQIQDVESGKTFDFHLVNPREADIKTNRLSVLAPIGVALLGYRPGVEVDWEMPNGLKVFRIVHVERREID